jgi:hypothetical protein
MNGQVSPAAEINFETGLRRLGYEFFRPGQREAIETLTWRRSGSSSRASAA